MIHDCNDFNFVLYGLFLTQQLCGPKLVVCKYASFEHILDRNVTRFEEITKNVISH